MINEEEMIEEMQELIKKLNHHTMLYDLGKPQISDREWDDMYFKLMELERKVGFSLSGSPSNHIDYKIVNELEKVEHTHPMLSLDKTKSLDEIKQFISNKDCILMSKMDGLTVSLRYENGRLMRAETRGNGEVGENILHNASVIRNIPKRIPYNEILTVDGEVISTYSNFKQFSDEYANPRNFAAGSLRLLDSGECEKRGLSFIAWDCIEDIEDSLFFKLYKLYQLGFETVPYSLVSPDNLEEAIDFMKSYEDYPIDGCVIKVNNCQEYRDAGMTGHHPRLAISYKFYDEEYESELVGIDFDVSRFGVLTPVAIFKPIDFGDSIVERATLSNLSILEQTLGKPWIGQKVYVAKMNMIIPKILRAEKDNELSKEYIDLESIVCPVCGHPAQFEYTDGNVKILKCSNEDCSGKIVNQLDYFCGKKGMDIKGLSRKTLEKLIEWKWVATFEDIFELARYRDKWIKKEGFGQSSVDKILRNIQYACSNVPLDKYICAIGIPLIGSSNAKEIIKHVNTWNEFRNLIYEHKDFTSWDTFGEEKSKALLDFNYAIADVVADRYLYFKLPLNKTQETSQLNGLNIVCTGKLTYFKNRDELKEWIEAKGGKLTGSVSAKTDYLIINDVNSQTSKAKKARELGIKLITDTEFKEIVCKN